MSDIGADQATQRKPKMAQIVCIDIGTVRDGICDVYDVVEMQEDNVELTGAGYENLKIIKITNLTVAEVMAVVSLNGIDTDQIINEPDPPIDIWKPKQSATWYELQVQPKFNYTFEDLTQADINTLADELATTPDKLAVLNKVKHKVPLYIQNLANPVE